VSVQLGWLIRSGDVLASAVKFDGFAAHAVMKHHVNGPIGAVVVDGPAVVLGSAVVRLSGPNLVTEVQRTPGVHVVGFGKRAYALTPTVASSIHVDDEVVFRVTS
jgi:hypothetical protein